MICLIAVLLSTGRSHHHGSAELVNISGEPGEALWRDINQNFEAKYESEYGSRISIRTSHAPSRTQAKSVIEGAPADVVTLALWSDTDAIAKAGLIRSNWEESLPNRCVPYTSTVVFVVRKGNPKDIHDWPDLVKDNVVVVAANPKTSANGKVSFLAAWGSVLHSGGSEDDARKYVAQLYQHAPVLEPGLRDSTRLFVQRHLGDVHVTWENDAIREVQASGGELELVTPRQSIVVEPHVAIVDANVERHGTRKLAEEYLSFLYTPEGQEIVARNFYRPTDPEVLQRHAGRFPEIERFEITEVAANWDAAQTRFFADGAIFDSLYQPPRIPRYGE
jgi:sulfate transport system substrate-binding protein